MRIIFLDFDGVLNTPLTWGKFCEGDGRHAIDVDKTRAVAAVCEELDAYVVISSAWRIGRTLGELRDLLEARGFKNAQVRVIDRTPDLEHVERGHEIDAWLQANPNVTAYVVLDDSDDMDRVRHRFVNTSYNVGVTAQDLTRARWHLLRSFTPSEQKQVRHANQPAHVRRRRATTEGMTP